MIKNVCAADEFQTVKLQHLGLIDDVLNFAHACELKKPYSVVAGTPIGPQRRK